MNKIVSSITGGVNDDGRQLYRRLTAGGGGQRSELGEGMSVMQHSIGGYWKPRYLLDDTAQTAVEFIDAGETLQTVGADDILWETFSDASPDILHRARCLSFHFPSFIYGFKNGVAEVRWQLNPDGMYYMDEDGYGMTADREFNIYGFIDRRGRVVAKFRSLSGTDIGKLRAEAEAFINEE